MCSSSVLNLICLSVPAVTHYSLMPIASNLLSPILVNTLWQELQPQLTSEYDCDETVVMRNITYFCSPTSSPSWYCLSFPVMKLKVIENLTHLSIAISFENMVLLPIHFLYPLARFAWVVASLMLLRVCLIKNHMQCRTSTVYRDY